MINKNVTSIPRSKRILSCGNGDQKKKIKVSKNQKDIELKFLNLMTLSLSYTFILYGNINRVETKYITYLE